MRLDGQVAVVTGAASGIGREVASKLARAGAKLVIADIDRDGALRAAEELKRSGAQAAGIGVDVANEDEVEASMSWAVETFGRLDVLVNNAGNALAAGRLESLDLAAFDQIMGVHVRGALAHIKHASPLMRAQAAGSIVNICSVAGHRSGYSSSINYAIAKAALLHLTRCAAMELGEDHVRVNSISPGGIATGVFGKAIGVEAETADASADKVKDFLAKMQAIPRAGLPDDIAKAALFLASDDSSFVNGADIVVDGGLIGGRRFSEVALGGTALRAAFD
jgi:NAD(P)-dependent dehydrogenase (short-subunit alcohol dehydrogenase family)